MASDVEFRKLNNLRVIDLRTELGKRNLDKTGVKNELIERLQKALISEGHDPEQYLFDLESPDKKTSRSSKRRTLDESDVDREENGLIDSSSVGEEETKNMKDQEVSKQDGDVTFEEVNCEDIKEETIAEEISTAAVEDTKEKEVKVKMENIENASPQINQSVVENSDTEKVVIKEDKLAEEKNVKNDIAPKEQRVNVSKKLITEESKEKSNDVNKEDNEDSINLTIGEDEVKLFGEEEETTHEKDIKGNDETRNTTTETEKEIQNDNSKTDTENKLDQKSTGKKVSNPKNIGNSRNLWVSGLSSMTRATDLKTLFSKYGKVVAAKIVTNAKTPGSRCYGYVTMLSTEDAAVSMQNLHKTELDGRMILVERAKDDGTGPARPKTIKKEPEKKKVVEMKEEKKPLDEKRKIIVLKTTTESEPKIDDKKEEKKTTSQKDTTEDVNGESKTGSVKSDKITSHHDKLKRSRSKEKLRNKSREPVKYHRSGVLTFAQIKEERERHRLKEKERVLRLEERRRQIERERQREIERRQREEAIRLERERMKLKMEREKMKAELLKLEREAQRLERERLQREKEELRRAQMKLEETRRAVKRPLEDEPRRVTKRPLEITRTFEDDRKRRPPSPDRRHVHVSSSSSSRKEISSRSNGARRPSPAEYVSRRGYETNAVESSRKEQSSHSTRDKSTKESSRYDHHYQSSHGNEEVRSKDMRHRYPDPPSKSSGKDSGRYERGGPSENWGRSSSNMSSSVKPFSGMGGGTISAREAWGSSSSDRKTEQPPWTRSTVGSSTSDRWASSSASASGMSMSRSGPVGNSSAMFSSSGSYSDSIPSMGMMGLSSGPSYGDRFDAYKSNLRKY